MKKHLYLVFVMLLSINLVGFAQTSSTAFYKSIGLNSSESSPSVYLFGNGGLRSSVTGNSNPNSPMNGSIGATFIKDRSELMIGFTFNDLNALSVTNEVDFGNNLLIPDISGQSMTLSYKHMFKSSFWGIGGNAIVASSKWKLDDNKEYVASPLSGEVNAIWAPFRELKGKNSATIVFEGGLTARYLLGEIGNKDDDRLEYYKTENKFFYGADLGVRLVLNGVNVFLKVPYLLSSERVDNLTNGQVIFGVTISGDFIEL